MTSLDPGRRIAGWGRAVAWLRSPETGGLGTQNIVLLAINLFGVDRYLIRTKRV